MSEHLHNTRQTRRSLGSIVVVALTVAFYLALVPVAVLFSGPIYRALQCQLGDCTQPGTPVQFVLQARGALRVGSAIRLQNGEPVGEVTAFGRTGNERYTIAQARIDPSYEALLAQPLRCQVTANFNLEMDADIVVSACPGLELPMPVEGQPDLVCGAVDHFERMGQEVRRFVLENVRPGEQPSPVRLTGPCGADNEAATQALRRLLAQ